MLTLLVAQGSVAEPLRIAVAANFRQTASLLLERYTERYHQETTMQVASTGTLYAQIIHGAPFDVFLAADQERPMQLEMSGLTVTDSRTTYAIGELALVPPEDGPNWREKLARPNVRTAIANPQTAPYGAAALQAISGDRENSESYTLIRANNVAQAYQMLQTGNTDYALVSRAQVASVPHRRITSDSYEPIIQQAVQIQHSTNHPAASGFLNFLSSQDARSVIRDAGYLVPGDSRQ